MWLMNEHGVKWEIEDQAIKKGGEGEIHRVVGHGDLVAKIYKEGALNQTREEKLAYMASAYTEGLKQLAWPQHVILDPYGHVKGFIMRRFDATEDMADLLDGTASGNQLDWRKRVVVALNLSYLVNEIHTMGQAIGDMNPKNFGVDMNTGFVCAFDTDSFHIYNQNNRKWYPCTVLDEHYVAPELQEKLQQGARVDSFRPEDTFTVQTDRFALAILIFQLLFLGVHPFTAARVASRGSSVLIHRRETNIYQRMCPFFNPAPYTTIPVYAPPLSIVPPQMREMFKKAFLEDNRPEARDWAAALSQLILQMDKCDRGHYYARYTPGADCPWCAMEKRTGDQPSRLSSSSSPSSSSSSSPSSSPSSSSPSPSSPPPRSASKGYRLVDHQVLQKAMKEDSQKKQQNYYDGSTQEKAIIVSVKMKAAEEDRKIPTARGEVTIPAGLDIHEMIHFQNERGENLYIQQNITTPNVFSWLCASIGGIWAMAESQAALSFLGGAFLGLLAGAFIDGLCVSSWESGYRKRMHLDS